MGYGSGSRDAKKSAPTHRAPMKECGFGPRAAPGFADGGFIFNGADPMYADNSISTVRPSSPAPAPSTGVSMEDETGGSRPPAATTSRMPEPEPSVTEANSSSMAPSQADDETGGTKAPASTKGVPEKKATVKKAAPKAPPKMAPRSSTKMSDVPSQANPSERDDRPSIRNSPGDAYTDALNKVSFSSIAKSLFGKKTG